VVDIVGVTCYRKYMILHGIAVASNSHVDIQCESVYILNTKAIIIHILQNNIAHYKITRL